MGFGFEIEDVTVLGDEIKHITAEVRWSGKSCYIPYFMVKYGDARNLDEIIALEWDNEPETVIKHFAKKALELGFEEFKVIDGIGNEYVVKVTGKTAWK